MNVISKKAVIGRGVRIGNNVVIEDRVKIGDRTHIHNNVVVKSNVNIGKHVSILDGCILGRAPVYSRRHFSRIPSRHLGKLSIGDFSTVGSNVVLYQGVAIGKNVVICDFSSIREECIIGRDTVLGRGALLNYGIKIGRGVRIMDSCHFGGNMIIGDSVFIGPHVSSANDNYFELKAQERKRGALIKKDAKIGVGCILLANITIGEGAIIGAGSLVTRSVAAHVLAYGSPARTIKLLSRDAAFA